MFGLGMQELLIIGAVAVLLFGKKLPEVARSLGGSYREFKRGLSDIQAQVDFSDAYYAPPPSKSARTSRTASSPTSYDDDYDDYEQSTAPKFEPPPAEPQTENPDEAKP